MQKLLTYSKINDKLFLNGIEKTFLFVNMFFKYTMYDDLLNKIIAPWFMCDVVTSSETSKVAKEVQFSPQSFFFIRRLPPSLLLFDVRNTDLAPQWVIANKHQILLFFLFFCQQNVLGFLSRFSPFIRAYVWLVTPSSPYLETEKKTLLQRYLREVSLAKSPRIWP